MKFTRRIFVSALLLMAGLALTFSSPQSTETVEAGGSDCQLAGQLCRDISQGLYNVCIAGPNPDYEGCALMEANATINCMTGAGCPLNH